MDEKFTLQIQDWLNAKPEERDYSVGALYLLKLSGNQIMYRNLVARDNAQAHEYIEYQLQKYLNFRLADLTHKEVAAMDALHNDIADRSTGVSKAYRRGLSACRFAIAKNAASKIKLHSQEMMLAQVGSPLAIENAHRNLLDMEDDE